jgi:hypothetical protein
MLIVLMTGGTSFAQAETLFPEYDDHAIERINRLSEIGKCQDAWDLFFSYVERRNDRAAYDLAIAIGWGAISPPLSKADPMTKDFFASFISSMLSFSIISETGKDAEVNEFRMEVFSLTWNTVNFEKAIALGCFQDFSTSQCQSLAQDEQARRSIYQFIEIFEKNRQLGIAATCNGGARP